MSALEENSEQFETITFEQFRSLKSFDTLHHVYRGMYISGCLCAKDPRLLLSTGITHVINLADDLPYDPFYFHDDRISYYDFPTSEQPEEKRGVFKHLKTLIPLIYHIRKNQQKVLVHCFAGVNRSSTVLLCAMMIIDRLTLPDALLVIKAARSYIRPSPLHLELLCKLNKKLFQQDLDLQKVSELIAEK